MTCPVCRFCNPAVTDRCPRCRIPTAVRPLEVAGEDARVSFDLPRAADDTGTTPSVTLLADTRLVPQSAAEG